MHQVSITVEKFMKETDEELKLAEDMKNHEWITNL